MASEPKVVVRRLVDEVINGQDLDVLDAIVASKLAPKLRRAFSEFRAAFPDWHQELVELVAEDTTVVARFKCTGTHRGAWQGLEPTGRTMRIDEVYFFGVTDGRVHRMWGLEDTCTRLRQLQGDDVELGLLGSLS
jgi:predicted ester cyclase